MLKYETNPTQKLDALFQYIALLENSAQILSGTCFETAAGFQAIHCS